MKNTRTVDFLWQFDASFALTLASVCQFLQANAVCKGVWGRWDNLRGNGSAWQESRAVAAISQGWFEGGKSSSGLAVLYRAFRVISPCIQQDSALSPRIWNDFILKTEMRET
mgnify:CR=1 FL=1